MIHLVFGIVAYLIGSIPFSYLIARSRGVDLHQAGSGVASPANVRHLLGFRLGVLALVLDVTKALVPVLLVKANIDSSAAAYVALWAMIGHVWPIWLRFNGGRGMAIFVFTAAVLLPREIFVLAAILLPIARLIHDTAPPAAACVVLTPVVALTLDSQLAALLPWFAWQQGGGAAAHMYALMAVLILLRRMIAPGQSGEGAKAMLSRLVFDRPDPRRHWTLDSKP